MNAQTYLDRLAEKLAKANEAYDVRIEVRATVRTDAKPCQSSVVTATAQGEIADLDMESIGGVWNVVSVRPRKALPWGVADLVLSALVEPALVAA